MENLSSKKQDAKYLGLLISQLMLAIVEKLVQLKLINYKLKYKNLIFESFIDLSKCKTRYQFQNAMQIVLNQSAQVHQQNKSYIEVRKLLAPNETLQTMAQMFTQICCKYNCIVSSTVPENMTDWLNLIYSTSVSAIKDGERQWFHVFNREQCLTLKELLDFRKVGFIEIQNGQIALLMIKIIQKFAEMVLSNVVHGNLTFDNVWIIYKSGFWPPNQEHNYEIVFVKHQGTSSNHQRMLEISLTLNEIEWAEEKERILDLFMGNKEKRFTNLANLALDLKQKVNEKTQTLTGYWSEISIHNKLKRFADPNIFTALLPLSETLGKSKFEQSLNWHYLDECRNIIIQYMLQSGVQQRIQRSIQLRIPTSIQQRMPTGIKQIYRVIFKHNYQTSHNPEKAIRKI